jgi:hypothetical protein
VRTALVGDQTPKWAHSKTVFSKISFFTLVFSSFTLNENPDYTMLNTCENAKKSRKRCLIWSIRGETDACLIFFDRNESSRASRTHRISYLDCRLD